MQEIILIKELSERSRGEKMGLFRCFCGVEWITSLKSVRSGNAKSCNCLQKTAIKRIGNYNITHGKSGSSEYKIYRSMKDRCYKKNVESYPNYGGRGIVVCEHWLKCFENFYKDMGDRPSKNHSLHRKDNDGPYSPENCVWATGKEQCRNRRKNRFLTLNGETKVLQEWAEITGLGRSTISNRIDDCGWSEEKALTTPIMKNQFG